MTLEEAIYRHINANGNGFELDDVISSGKYSFEVENRIIEISERFKSSIYPIGISNPESFAELKALAVEFGKTSPEK